MIKFDLNTYIYRPLQQVFAFVAMPENDFHWQYGTLISTLISKGEMGVGTLFRAVSHFLGRRIESVYQVTEFEPNKRYGFKSLSGPLDSHTLYTFEVMKGSTRINISTQISLGEVFESNPTTAEKVVKKQYRENLALLKDVLEASQVDRSSESTWLVSSRRKSDFR
jgi:polyketide cyclase/dehydrase/lipid transport protein